MKNLILLLVVCVSAYTSIHKVGAKSESITRNKSRPKLLPLARSGVPNLEFFPTYFPGGQDRKSHLLKLDTSEYVLPEPGCTCVQQMKDCDFECCYCQLNCPLPKSSMFIEDWLKSFYGNGCKDRESKKKNAGVTGRQRRDASWRKIWSFCDRPNYSLNAQTPTFPFICVLFDNSYTSLHFSMRPPQPNLIRMTNLTPVRHTWPAIQRFYNNCLPVEAPGKEGFAKSIDKSYLLLLHVRQLFYLQPPPPEFMNSHKGHLSQDKLCLSERKSVDEIMTLKRKTRPKTRHQQETVEMLDQAIEHLGQRKTNYLANFKVKLKKMPDSCQQYRNDLEQVSKYWLQKFKIFAQGNRTRDRNITMTRMEKENLSRNKNWRSETSAERFPEKCRNIVAGMEVHALFSREDVFEITYQMFTHDVAVKSSPSFFIQIKSMSATKTIPRDLSRFWSNFILYECPDQFCWRDIFDFSYLLADTVVVLLIFLSAATLSALIFTKVGFCGVF